MKTYTTDHLINDTDWAKYLQNGFCYPLWTQAMITNEEQVGLQQLCSLYLTLVSSLLQTLHQDHIHSWKHV